MPASLTSRFAAATSVLALAVATGGSSYAAVKIGTKQLKNNAVTSQKIKNDAVTGADVLESSLAKVPSAGTADSATTAGKATTADNAASAGSVNGMKLTKVAYRGTPNTGARVLFQDQGLTITASCSAATDTTLSATSSVPNASIYAAAAPDNSYANPLGNDLESGGFDPGVTFDLLVGGSGNTDLITFAFDTPAGAVVTGTLSADEADDCVVAGTVVSG
ncbi:hypothetical protein [Nocardioides flavescens]|uniref:Uncharacterized protein n=1 Tax=Nocardioides flavescens TaxID=2691959 RepID=A0A6L7ENN3_9ACTN|nr:hypothetical protein [Nocardioides flavescens]MXG88943.1 hypothetical protein [Nocardioides flavescens]